MAALRLLALGLALAALASPARSAADLAQKLRHDPFAAKPWLLRPATDSPAAAESRTRSHPPLRAVLAAGADSRALLGSQLLRIGESSGEYRLIEVRERSALFDQAGRKVEIGLGSPVLP